MLEIVYMLVSVAGVIILLDGALAAFIHWPKRITGTGGLTYELDEKQWCENRPSYDLFDLVHAVCVFLLLVYFIPIVWHAELSLLNVLAFFGILTVVRFAAELVLDPAIFAVNARWPEWKCWQYKLPSWLKFRLRWLRYLVNN